jgi:hypothetical protein
MSDEQKYSEECGGTPTWWLTLVIVLGGLFVAMLVFR